MKLPLIVFVFATSMFASGLVNCGITPTVGPPVVVSHFPCSASTPDGSSMLASTDDIVIYDPSDKSFILSGYGTAISTNINGDIATASWNELFGLSMGTIGASRPGWAHISVIFDTTVNTPGLDMLFRVEGVPLFTYEGLASGASSSTYSGWVPITLDGMVYVDMTNDGNLSYAQSTNLTTHFEVTTIFYEADQTTKVAFIGAPEPAAVLSVSLGLVGLGFGRRSRPCRG